MYIISHLQCFSQIFINKYFNLRVLIKETNSKDVFFKHFQFD